MDNFFGFGHHHDDNSQQNNTQIQDQNQAQPQQQPAAPRYPAPPSTVVYIQQPPPPKPLVPRKSRVIAALLALFLGGIGVHKFYLGKWVQGILYLALCWTYIPAIVGLIEGIVYLCSSNDGFAKKYGGYY